MMIWETCVKGHDLTAEDAWLYRASGIRECRQCVLEDKSRKRHRIKFDLA